MNPPKSLKRTPQRLLPTLTTALIAALVSTTYMISYGSLIFSGELTPYLASGIGFCLMGVVLIASIEALLSGSPGLVAIPTVNSAVIIASMAAAIASQLDGQSETIFPTVTAAITIATLLTGAAFLGLGWFRLGNLIRYIPYPVIGGFLAGTGWLVVRGALKTMTDIPFSLANIDQYLQAEVLFRWLPGVLFGILVLMLVRRYKHYLISPLMILGAILVFFLLLWLSGSSIQQAIQSGWLFQPFPPGALWQPPPLGDLAAVDWSTIASQAGQIATLILISSITLLLYANGVEVSAGIEIDLNRELRACGTGNLAAGFSASPPGYTIVTMSVLSNKLGARSRLVGLLVAGLCGAVMLFGGNWVALMPKVVLGGVLVYLGLTFLVEWLYDGWRKLPRTDYAIVVAILLVMGSYGLLPGLGVGVAIAAALFVVRYSHVPVVRHTLSGNTLHSRVERPSTHFQILHQEGQGLMALTLQGYLFFGTANQVFEQVRAELLSRQEHPPWLVLLDFRQVSGIDTSAALSFLRLKRLLSRQKILLAFTNLNPKIEQILKTDVLTSADRDAWRVFNDLDHGVEWFEDRVLHGEGGERLAIQAQPGMIQDGQERGGLALIFVALSEQLELADDTETAALMDMMSYLERMEFEKGQALIRQGEQGDALYFLDAGELVVELSTDGGQSIRLARSGPGTVIGELSMFLNTPASATVIAELPVIVYRLSGENMRRLERENALAAAALHRYLLKRVAQRLLMALDTVEALAE